MKRSLVLVLALGCGGKPVAPPPVGNAAAPPVALAGECVDPKADAKARMESGSTGTDTSMGNFEVTTIEDLDGDGAGDTKVFFGFSMFEKTSLYVMRGSCGIFVGDADGSLTVEATRTKGFRELHVSESVNCEGARCGCEPGGSYLVWDGTQYVVDKARVKESVATECPDGTDPHGD